MENAAPYLTNNFFYGSPVTKKGKRSRPSTSHGDHDTSNLHNSNNDEQINTPGHKPKDRKFSLRRRSSSFTSSPSKTKRRPSSSAGTNGGGGPYVTTATADDISRPPLTLNGFARAAYAKVSRENEVAVQSPTSADSFTKMMSRTAPGAASGFSNMAGTSTTSFAAQAQQASLHVTSLPQESNIIYQHVHEIANKRISTLDYLRKAHDGRVYWFNTLLFEKPDLARMPYFDPRKLARRATNYLLLGLSLPTVIDLNSSTPLEFLRSLHTLFSEFESFQQIHTENGTNASSLSRARLPQMFRRGPAGKGRRTSGAGDIGFYNDMNGSIHSGGATQTPTSVISFGLGGEGNELLPGEEYTHLLTPSLPFDPDFFETFATLCDMLIDCYTKLMSLLPMARDCTPLIAELFTKVDGKVRKIIIQGAVKEFEDTSRAALKQEVGSVGKVVLGGLM